MVVRYTMMALDCNTFKWVKNLYQQRFGTDIGNPLAPPYYSGLYMGELGREAMQEWADLYPDKGIQI